MVFIQLSYRLLCHGYKQVRGNCKCRAEYHYSLWRSWYHVLFLGQSWYHVLCRGNTFIQWAGPQTSFFPTLIEGEMRLEGEVSPNFQVPDSWLTTSKGRNVYVVLELDWMLALWGTQGYGSMNSALLTYAAIFFNLYFPFETYTIQTFFVK